MRALLFSSLLLVAACHVPRPVERPYPPPTIDAALAALKARSARLSAVGADARVEYKDKRDHVKLGADLLAARGGKLRIEAHVPLQGTVATLVSDGTTFALLDVKNNQFLTGPANACNVARLIRVELAPDEVVRVLLGEAPDLDEARPISLDWDKTHGGREVLTLAQPDGGREQLFLDGRDNKWDLLEARRTDSRGHLLWRIENDDWQDQNGIRLPRRTHVAQPPSKVELWLRYKEEDVNPPVKEGVFQLSPPTGVPVRPVNC